MPENRRSPTEVVCPNCNAQIGQPCTYPTSSDRKPTSWFHLARHYQADYGEEDKGDMV